MTTPGMTKCECGQWFRANECCQPCRDIDHAVALERERIAAWLNLHCQVPDEWEPQLEAALDKAGVDLCGDDDCLFWDMTYALAQAIRNGEHCREVSK